MTETKAQEKSKKSVEKVRIPPRIMVELRQETARYNSEGKIAPAHGEMIAEAWDFRKAALKAGLSIPKLGDAAIVGTNDYPSKVGMVSDRTKVGVHSRILEGDLPNEAHPVPAVASASADQQPAPLSLVARTKELGRKLEDFQADTKGTGSAGKGMAGGKRGNRKGVGSG